MNWKKAIGFGIVIWILMFVIVSIFIGFKIYGSVVMSIITALIAGVLSFLFAGKLKLKSAGSALCYGIVWLIIGYLLDLIITSRFNAQILSSWSLWLGYVLILLAPLLTIKKNPVVPTTPIIPTAPTSTM